MLRVLLTVLVSSAAFAETIGLDELDLARMTAGWGQPRANRSVQDQLIRIAGQGYDRGAGTHAHSVLYVALDGAATAITGAAGIDDEVDGALASVRFRVLGDGKVLWDSGVRKANDPAVPFEIDLRGVRTLVLIADPAGDGVSFDHADWADVRIAYEGARPEATDPPREAPYILTPPAPREPRINGPRVFGVRPGSPFLFTIPATGDRPMTFAAEGLPDGLTLEAATGRITGTLPAPSEHRVTLHAKNALGEATRDFRIVAGDTIALTPPMGWNSWYCYFDSVTDEMMRAAADAMVASGMINHGYAYVNIDDGWSVRPGARRKSVSGEERDAAGKINANNKFPDMRALTDYIHSLGLKAGIYTSPGPTTCAGYAGAYQHEERDAARFAEWGFDFLKYDWCSYGAIAPDPTPEELKAPYLTMRRALDAQPRDIVYNLCQYGMGNVWEWGADVGGNCWRTTGDLGIATDLFSNIVNYGFFHHDKAWWNRPGHYNDPDYLLIGHIGWRGELRPTPLTPNEQYFYISLWALLAAPFIFSGDISRLDDFTLSLLTNDEVLEVDQDPLCRAAAPAMRGDLVEAWAKDMEDGSKAVGLFNLDEIEREVRVTWADLGVTGSRRVRDLWRQRDLGSFDRDFTGRVPRHGVVLVRVFPEEK